MTNLQELWLGAPQGSDQITDAELVHLKDLTELRELRLGGTKVTDAGIAELQKAREATYKDGKREGLTTEWYAHGQKAGEETYKDGKLVSETKWDKEGNEIKE